MTYFDTLIRSTLPLPPLAVVALWPVLYLVNLRLVARIRAQSVHASRVTMADREAVDASSRPHWMLVQVLYAASVFAFSLYAGGALFVFLGGGLDISLGCVLAMNAHALASGAALRRPGAAEGTMTLSAAYALRQLAARQGALAVLCVCIGLLLAHLAPLGAAFVCAAAGLGYLRRAEDLERRQAR